MTLLVKWIVDIFGVSCDFTRAVAPTLTRETLTPVAPSSARGPEAP
jgi:hypothetical protein